MRRALFKTEAVAGLLLLVVLGGCSDKRAYVNRAYEQARTFPANNAIRQRILLIGDAGAPDRRGERCSRRSAVGPVLFPAARW